MNRFYWISAIRISSKQTKSIKFLKIFKKQCPNPTFILKNSNKNEHENRIFPAWFVFRKLSGEIRDN